MALDGVDFRLFPGRGARPDGRERRRQVHPDQGADRRLRHRRRRRSRSTASRCASPARCRPSTAGVSTVYQEVNLCANLSVAENIFIGREPRRLGRIQLGAMRRGAAEALLARRPRHRRRAPLLGTYSLAIQQMVAIARAVDIDAKVLILDEPTSSLDAAEVEQLFAVMRRLQGRGHRDPVRLALPRPGLRDLRPDHRAAQRPAGRRVPDRRAAAGRAGREDDRQGARRRSSALEEQAERSPPTLEARRRCSRRDGLGRNGRDRAVRPRPSTTARSSAWPACSAPAAPSSPGCCSAPTAPTRAARRVDGSRSRCAPRAPRWTHGIAFCSENRRTEGARRRADRAGEHHPRPAGRPRLDPADPAREQDELVDKYIKALDIRPADPEQPVRNLSGGNQQKVLLARWLITEPQLLILDEPTRGIDVGAKAEIQQLVVSSSPTAAWRCCSSPPSWRRCCGSATRSRCCATGTWSRELANDRRADDGRDLRHADHRAAERAHDHASRTGCSGRCWSWSLLLVGNVLFTPTLLLDRACRTATSTAA